MVSDSSPSMSLGSRERYRTIPQDPSAVLWPPNFTDASVDLVDSTVESCEDIPHVVSAMKTESSNSTILSSDYLDASRSSQNISTSVTRSDSVDDAVQSLKAFFSQANLTSENPRTESAASLKGLYMSLKSQGQIHRLLSKDMSSLISLFGCLSLKATKAPLIARRRVYVHALAMRVPDQVFEIYWPFVEEIARDKARLHRALTFTDHYWLMLSALAEICPDDGKEGISSLPISHSVSESLGQARTHYRHICRSRSSPNVHIHILQTLRAFPSTKHVDEGLDYLRTLLSQHKGLHQVLGDFAWQLISEHGTQLSSLAKERFVEVLRNNLADADFDARRKFSSNTPPSNSGGEHRSVSVTSRAAWKSGSASWPLGAFHLLDALKEAIISCSHQSGPPYLVNPEVHSWAVAQARSVFSMVPDTDSKGQTPGTRQWRMLSVLASATESTDLSTPHLDRITVDEDAVEWKLVCEIAEMEKMLRSTGRPYAIDEACVERYRDVSWRLWHIWRRIDGSTQRPDVVIRAVALSFLRITCSTADTRLKDEVHRYYPVTLSSSNTDGVSVNVSEGAQVRAYAVTYVVASGVCGDRNWADIFTSLGMGSAGVIYRPTASDALLLSKIVSVLRQHDPIAAYDLYTWSHLNGVELTAPVVSYLGHTLARNGHFNLALRCLANRNLLLTHAKPLMNDILTSLIERRYHNFSPDLLERLGDSMLKIYTSPAAHSPNTSMLLPIESALLSISIAGDPTKSLAIVHAILDRNVWSSSWFRFRASFLGALMRNLLKQRQFRLAVTLLERVQTEYPTSTAAKWRTMVFAALARAGAGNLIAQTTRNAIGSQLLLSSSQRLQDLPYRDTVHMRLLRAVNFQTRAPPRASALKVLALVSRLLENKNKDPTKLPNVLLAASLLLRAGRLTALRRLHERVQRDKEMYQKLGTAFGNLLLSGSLAARRGRRNARQIRRLFVTLGTLIKKYSFVPDRVTVNILIKGMLRWDRLVDSMKLRVLFDGLVMSGYPDGGKGRLPFGTVLENFRGTPVALAVSLPQLRGEILFERHTKPLYKMFVKAFHLRGDLEAARLIVGILKEEERRDSERKQRLKSKRHGSTVKFAGP